MADDIEGRLQAGEYAEFARGGVVERPVSGDSIPCNCHWGGECGSPGYIVNRKTAEKYTALLAAINESDPLADTVRTQEEFGDGFVEADE